MRWVYVLKFLLRPFRSLGKAQDEVDAELEFHVAMETQKNLDRGLAPAEARRRALIAFGGMDRFKEEVRDVDGISLFERVRTDVRYGLRILRRNPVFTAVAVFTLALGIGGSTSIYSVVDGIMLRPLPYPESDRLVTVWADFTRRGGPVREWLGYPNLRDVQRLDHVFEEVALYNDYFPTLTGRGEAQSLNGTLVSYGMLTRVLRVEPGLGRAFTPEDDQPGAPRTLLLSHGLWSREFGQDPAIVGTAVTLDDEPYTIIGVMPEGFRQPFLEQTDFWTPVRWSDTDHRGSRGSAIIRSVARLAPGVSLETARTETRALGARLEQEYPESNTGVGYAVFPLRADMVQGTSTALWLLLGAVGLVLLLVCVNLANLLLARATGRESELAVRSALGARRSRLVNQLLTESLLLALVGGTLGILLAFLGTDLLVAMAPPNVPRLQEVAVDGRIIGFALTITLTAGVLFGLVPSLKASRMELRGSLTQGARSGGDRASGRALRKWLVAGQVSLALVLLVGAGLLLRSFNALRAVDLGFDPENVVTMTVNMPESRYPDTDAVRGAINQIEERLAALPGISDVGMTNALPLGGLDGDTDFSIEGRPPPPPGQENTVWIRRVSPTYFNAIGMRLVEGRAFEDSDRMDTDRVVIVNRSLADRFFGDESAVGRRINVNDASEPVWRTIVGVADDVRNFGIRGDAPNAMYFPLEQLAARRVTVVVRATGDPSGVMPLVRREAAGFDPSMALSLVPMDAVVQGALAQDRFVTNLLLLFAALALVLAAVGLYGVVSYDVGRRMHEIGIRMALGARNSEIGRMVVGSSLSVAAIGIVLGVLAALLLTRVMSSLLFGVSPTDPATFVAVVMTLLTIAVVASTLPALRAVRVDPVGTLKAE